MGVFHQLLNFTLCITKQGPVAGVQRVFRAEEKEIDKKGEKVKKHF